MPAGNAVVERAHGFLVNDDVLLPILKAFYNIAHAPYAQRGLLCFQSVCSRRESFLPIAVQ